MLFRSVSLVDENMPGMGGVQSAVTVKELAERPQSDGKSKGLLDRLRNKGSEAVENGAGGIEINDDARRNLQATLYELLECKRLLDQVR